MDFISTALVSLTPPTGFWQSILNAFKNGLGTYILAVIMIALIVRILFSAVDIINKKVNMKNADVNAKMKPELDAIKQRYGNDPQIMQQKTNEVYKKYQFNMMGSCLPMLLVMVLQFTVFLTLWNSLQAVSNFNIANQYQNMKTLYANVIEVNDTPQYLESAGFKEGDTISAEIFINKEDGQKYLRLNLSREGAENFTFIDVKYKEVKLDENNKETSYYSNQHVFDLLKKYVIQPTPEQGEEETQSQAEEEAPTQPEQPEVEYAPTKYSAALKAAAEEAVKEYFNANKEGFLWIKNIYKSESPTSPMFTKSEITTYVSKYYTNEEKEEEKINKYEEKIFDCIVENNASLDALQKQHNGYYILTIIAVLTSVLSLWLSNFLMRDKSKPKQKQSWAMYVIMPIIIGIFTFMYTSLFAIYLIVGQLVMMLLTPLTTFITKKWIAHDNNKKKTSEVIEVDYRRKDG